MAEELPTFEQWVRRRRRALDLTQDQLAQRARCSIDTIRKIEAGERRPSQPTAELLAQALDIPPAQQALFVRVARTVASAAQTSLLQELDAELTPSPAAAAAPASRRRTVAVMLCAIQDAAGHWQRQPRAMRAAHARLHSAIAAASGAHHGTLHSATHTLIAASFPTVTDAAAAAVTVHQTLDPLTWEQLGRLPFCTGIHIGTSSEPDGSVPGGLLHWLSELCTLGHAGQILLSLPAQQLAAADLPDGLTLRQIGIYEIAGVTSPIFQATGPQGYAAIQPLRTLPTLLRPPPAPPTPLIGREHEVATVRTLLHQSEVRLLTLTGPGGVGKTRLAQQIAHELADDFSDGVAFVPLAAIPDASFVVAALAQALALTLAPDEPPFQNLIAQLHGRRMLLILDNFEHILHAAPLIADLLTWTSGIKVLVTSQARLGNYNEQILRVQPLSLVADSAAPPTIAQALSSGAVQLFLGRARMVQPDFSLSEQNVVAVAELCRRLDGLPLAIELAAARIDLLPPAALLRRLDDRFALLATTMHDLPARQRTLRATLDWGYNLLEPTEQRLFRALAALSSGCAIETVAVLLDEPPDGSATSRAITLITVLLHRSLVQQTNRDDEPWFAMLETVRSYAYQQLIDSGEALQVQRRLIQRYLDRVEALEGALDGAQQDSAVAQLRREHDNLRSVLTWSLDAASSDPTQLLQAARLGAVLWRYWWLRGTLDEGWRWLSRLIAHRDRLPAALLAKLLRGAGILARVRSDLRTSAELLDQALVLYRQLGDQVGIARTLNNVGVVRFSLSDYDMARQLFEESLALHQASGNQHRVAVTLNNLGNIAYKCHDLDQAEQHYQQALSLLTGPYANQQTQAVTIANLGEIARLRRDYPQALRLLHESAQRYSALDQTEGVIFCLNNLVEIALDWELYQLAGRLLATADQLYTQIGAARSPDERRDYEQQRARIRANASNPHDPPSGLHDPQRSLAELFALGLDMLQTAINHARSQP